MIWLALLLVTVGVADAILEQPLAVDWSLRGRMSLYTVVAGAAACVNGLAHESILIATIMFLVLAPILTIWEEGRRKAEDSAGPRKLALGSLALGILASALLMPFIAQLLRPDSTSALAPSITFMQDLPWRSLHDLSPASALLAFALVLFLGSTSNAIVKTVLTIAREAAPDESERQLKGGRYIGPLERWLIFGLALAGQPTAAALVISAKSIIRFPELQSKTVSAEGVQGIDQLTEYFLIGSLLSWSLALLAALPLVALA